MTIETESGDLHRLLGKAHRLHYKRASTELAKIGITQGQPRVLHYLSQHDGCIQKDLANFFELEPATVTDILSIMERDALIRRESDRADKRVARVFLTAKGAKMNKSVEVIFAAVEEGSFKGFSAKEKEQLMRLLSRLYENLKNMESAK